MLNILIIYEYFPKRTTIIDHLYCFRRYSGHRCFYLNMALQSIPTFVKTFPWDLIIFHTVFLSSRWTREIFLKHQEKLEFVKNSDAVKICLPQDEFINMDLVCDFINKLKIDHVFSVAAENQWPIIYKKVDFNKVKFSRVLTGYIDGSTAARIHRIIKNCEENRPIDVGYRANHSEFWLGCHGAIKWQIGELFKDKASKLKIALDISTDPKDTIFGDDWYRFLARCKYQLGVEGGASILDWDGTYRKRTEAYLAAHRGALLKEVEEKCFPDAEGSLDLRAISPRHFESCLTRTCQILIEGDYNGILVPGKHYIV